MQLHPVPRCTHVFSAQAQPQRGGFGDEVQAPPLNPLQPHLWVEGMTGIRSSAELLGAHPVTLDRGIMCRSHCQGKRLMTRADSGESVLEEPAPVGPTALQAASRVRRQCPGAWGEGWGTNNDALCGRVASASKSKPFNLSCTATLPHPAHPGRSEGYI